MAKIKREPKAVAFAEEFIKNYNPESAQDVDEALKEIFSTIFEAMLQGEMNNHLGYESNNKDYKDTANRRNGYGKKTLRTTKGEVDIEVPRDRDASFEPKLIEKRQRDDIRHNRCSITRSRRMAKQTTREELCISIRRLHVRHDTQ